MSIGIDLQPRRSSSPSSRRCHLSHPMPFPLMLLLMTMMMMIAMAVTIAMLAAARPRSVRLIFRVGHAELLADEMPRQQTQQIGRRMQPTQLISVVRIGFRFLACMRDRHPAGLPEIIMRRLAAASLRKIPECLSVNGLVLQKREVIAQPLLHSGLAPMFEFNHLDEVQQA